MTTQAITPVESAPPAPWLPQPEETREAYARFLLWAHTPEAERGELSATARDLAFRHNWQGRAAALQLRLQPARDVRDVVNAVGSAALVILETELTAQAAASVQRPGSVPTRDLVALLSVVGSLGGWSALQKSDDGPELDLTLATPEEKQVLFKALPILERIRRKKQSTR